MIKAVIFDYGGVITSGGGGDEVAERFATYSQIPLEQAKLLVYKQFPLFMMGKISEQEYWQEIENAYSKPIPEAHRLIWNSWEQMSPRPEMIKFVNKLKSEGYTVGLLSNVIPITEKIIRDQNGYELFKPCLLSCNLGLVKPGVDIYEELLRQLPGINPEEIIFVDDQQRCLDPAIRLGIKTVLASDAQQIIQDVENLIKK